MAVSSFSISPHRSRTFRSDRWYREHRVRIRELRIRVASDGRGLGAYIRAQIAKTPIMTVSKIWDNGSVTSRLQGARSGRPTTSKTSRSVSAAADPDIILKALEAGPAPINFNEVYSALQTKVVDGQENPLPIIATNEAVMKCRNPAAHGHVWDGYWISATNARSSVCRRTCKRS